MRNDNIRGIAMMIASMAFFAIEDLFLKFLGPVMPPHQILFLVGYGGALAFVLWALVIRTPCSSHRVKIVPMIWISLISSAPSIAFQSYNRSGSGPKRFAKGAIVNP